MIPFSLENLNVNRVKIKSVTTALGGSVVIIDEKKSVEAGKECYQRIALPFAIARSFIKRYTMKNYITPIRGAITMYGNHAVAIERISSSDMELRDNWKPKSEENIEKIASLFDNLNDMYIDGSYIYKMTSRDISEATNKSTDGCFKKVKVNALKIADLVTQSPNTHERQCIMFSSGDRYMVSAPIWYTLDVIGNARFNSEKKTERDVEDTGGSFDYTGEDQFDFLEEMLHVNLGFVIKAGVDISRIFGYQSIEPLNLPNLMIQYNTVNLPKLASSIKQTRDSGVPFQHAVAWIMGLMSQVDNLKDYVALRGLLKHLTTKGVFRKKGLEHDKLFQNGYDFHNVPYSSKKIAASTVEHLLAA